MPHYIPFCRLTEKSSANNPFGTAIIANTSLYKYSQYADVHHLSTFECVFGHFDHWEILFKYANISSICRIVNQLDPTSHRKIIDCRQLQGNVHWICFTINCFWNNGEFPFRVTWKNYLECSPSGSTLKWAMSLSFVSIASFPT